ncbi:MAG: glycosyltransferase family 2 protein [Butyrivibrio sp.]|uniref:glycosyltransferase family 2 protein n=1 Tax=Butyrivibrio sp. TaxID=28121 RepID=UPI001B2CDD45|nr:glycosyltransferase family 2 protein [Butyrivibrio sp.]MBO6241708.1 glycosyltransferase family 2 protein [Butyrivibrio sp.]
MLNDGISVIIPTFNRKNYILNSVNSVLNQTYRNLEVIVVDDGSEDGTEILFNDFSDIRLRYYRLKSNHGVAYARNFGVEHSRYDVIAFNDSDDLWHEDKLQRQMEYWNEHEDDILVYCAYAMKENLNDKKFIKAPVEPISSSEYGQETFLYLLNQNTIGTPTILMKKKVFLQIGGFDTSLPALEDWDLAVRLSIIGKIGYLDEILVSVDAAIRPDRLSVQGNSYYVARCAILSKYESELADIGILDVYLNSIKEKARFEGNIEKANEIINHFFYKK